MSTLAEIRANVHSQMDIDSDDIADALINDYIREGFDRTLALEHRWPAFETTWSAALAAAATSFVLPSAPSEPASIESMVEDTSGELLREIPHRLAEELYSEGNHSSSSPDLFSVWGGVVYIWPQQNNTSTVDYTLRGFRKPVWSGVDGTELEGDERLHHSIFHYACSLAYAQFEDPELEQQYLRRWANSVDTIRRDVMRPSHSRPLILNAGLKGMKRTTGSSSLVWDGP